MGTLRIYLLGVFRISHDRYPQEIKIARAVKALLAFLILFSERIHARDVLAGLFWGDSSENQARSCLSTALWRLRKILEPEGIPRGTYLLTPSAGEVGFNQESNHWLDAGEFQSHAKSVLAKPYQDLSGGEVRQLEKALKLYNGDLLEDYYEDWALSERERLRSLYVKSQAHLLGYYGQKGGFDKALEYGHRILNLDPLREEIHREMMRLYMMSGRRAQAVRQYERCCKILEAELGVSPMEETRALCAQIIKGHAGEPVWSPSHGNRSPAHQALQQLKEALGGFDDTKEKLRQVGEILEQLMED